MLDEEGVDGIELNAVIEDFDYKPGTASLAAFGAATAGADYIKIGLLKITTRQEAIDLLTAVVKTAKGVDPTKKVVSAY